MPRISPTFNILANLNTHNWRLWTLQSLDTREDKQAASIDKSNHYGDYSLVGISCPHTVYLITAD